MTVKVYIALDNLKFDSCRSFLAITFDRFKTSRVRIRAQRSLLTLT